MIKHIYDASQVQTTGTNMMAGMPCSQYCIHAFKARPPESGFIPLGKMCSLLANKGCNLLAI